MLSSHAAGHAVPLEFNMDGLHALSFTKGCYVGQELIARAHYQGAVRKRLMPATVPTPDSAHSSDAETGIEGMSSQPGNGDCAPRLCMCAHYQGATRTPRSGHRAHARQHAPWVTAPGAASRAWQHGCMHAARWLACACALQHAQVTEAGSMHPAPR